MKRRAFITLAATAGAMSWLPAWLPARLTAWLRMSPEILEVSYDEYTSRILDDIARGVGIPKHILVGDYPAAEDAADFILAQHRHADVTFHVEHVIDPAVPKVGDDCRITMPDGQQFEMTVYMVTAEPGPEPTTLSISAELRPTGVRFKEA